MVTNLPTYARIFGRGFLIVFLTATNVYQVSHRHMLGGFIVGVLISVVWWGNARTSSRSELTGSGLCYGLGAGAGTLAGMAISSYLYQGR